MIETMELQYGDRYVIEYTYLISIKPEQKGKCSIFTGGNWSFLREGFHPSCIRTMDGTHKED